ncbi:MAG: error-prone DNA polymerase [Alphaproteobacteria bacterium]|nr:error-prone DNA polymerase [Alphaproteobacteria bacterium]
MTAYAELQVTSNFSFLRGASHPQELVAAARTNGLHAIALTDRNSLAGIVRAHAAANEVGMRLIVGTRLDLQDAPSLLCFPTDRAAYGRLTRLLTLGRRRAPKGDCHLTLADLADHRDGQVLILVPPQDQDIELTEIKAVKDKINSKLYLSASAPYGPRDHARIARLADLAVAADTPLVATNDVHAHSRARRLLQDVLTCIREGCTIAQAGYRLHANGERHIKPAAEMTRLFGDHPEAIARTIEIADRCRFSLDELRYEYPVDPAPEDGSPQAALERLTWAGARARFGAEVPAKVRTMIEHELTLIGELDYAPYFLTVHDIVRFARDNGILCQGRGSAANSAICYCLGITAVDPSRLDLLFERFVSAERNEPPDIDVDFEHERREEVIQYIYGKYGRDRAGLAATVISYRAKSAIREVGKVMGLSQDTVGALSKSVWGWSKEGIDDDYVREIGLDPGERNLHLALGLARELIGFPRHLSQHVGGFVITKEPLDEMVPIENAAMEDRTVIQWDKDDLDAAGMLKIDVLGLGMLTCIRKAFDLIERHYDKRYSLATVPAEDPAVYDMLCKADSIGVFQVESRAQMTMLPRLKPRAFYDLVIEVAIVRPGPIQGDMVHPYLRRRHGEEKVDYPSEELRQVLGKTLGVPLFQEQAMRIAIVGAGFTPAEADRLRRAMATFKKTGQIHTFREKLVAGMVARSYDEDFAHRCFNQIEGFGEYGFPESHAASFALLVYVSAWLKCHYPAVFACALLNSQPMGFYAPAQIVRDARDHGVEVRPADVNISTWDHSLEPAHEGSMALRLGLRQVKGLKETEVEKLIAARGNGYPDIRTLWRRAGVTPQSLEALARADAFGSMDLARRDAWWEIRALGPAPLPLFAAAQEDDRGADQPVALPDMPLGEQVMNDYAALRLTLKAHPIALLRHDLAREGVIPAARLMHLQNGDKVRVAGLVLVRQRPGSAKGVIFATLEDETGVANIVVWPPIFERFRRQVIGTTLMRVTGKMQREGIVIHVVADLIEDLSERLVHLSGDEVVHPGRDTRPPPLRRGTVRLRSRDFH